MALEVGSIVDGKVTGISNFGACVQIGEGKSGLVHISEISNTYVSDISQFLSPGQEVRVKVVSIDEKGRINLSIKKAIPEPSAPSVRVESEPAPRPTKALSFEEMMSKFKQESDDKLSGIKDVRENRKAKRSMR